jgi:hypothetical protein
MVVGAYSYKQITAKAKVVRSPVVAVQLKVELSQFAQHTRSQYEATGLESGNVG